MRRPSTLTEHKSKQKCSNLHVCEEPQATLAVYFCPNKMYNCTHMSHPSPSKKLPRYLTTTKEVGETPLVALERLRDEHHLDASIPLAYAGRLDPMASGKLLILVGDECKVQEKYHAFDKEYEVEILFGTSSDTGDVLGLLKDTQSKVAPKEAILNALSQCVGTITLPYPHFSSKTVQGKPLHTWTLENRLNEIEIPKKSSHIHKLTLRDIRTVPKQEVVDTVTKKIETIPRVSDPKKALGADFRREEVRKSWEQFAQDGADVYQIVSITCIASSGTYMRSLAEHIAHMLGTSGLAYSIHRTKIGTYRRIIGNFGTWTTRF